MPFSIAVMQTACNLTPCAFSAGWNRHHSYQNFCSRHLCAKGTSGIQLHPPVSASPSYRLSDGKFLLCFSPQVIEQRDQVWHCLSTAKPVPMLPCTATSTTAVHPMLQCMSLPCRLTGAATPCSQHLGLRTWAAGNVSVVAVAF
jgi:hypothetical protein